MPRSYPWYLAPITLLIVGVLLSGFVLWRIISGSPSEQVNRNAANRSVELPVCGNGICENVVCLSTNCPKPETAENCPEDCANETSTGNNLNEHNSNQNLNVSPSESAPLNFSFRAQTLDEKNTCPIEEANLLPSDVVAIAKAGGLTRGIGDVEVRLYKYDKPLEQCVWSVRNFETANKGNEFIIIDSTQEVFQQRPWQE